MGRAQGKQHASGVNASVRDFASLFGDRRGGGVERTNPNPDATAFGGPKPYTWYALVDPDTFEHIDSFISADSARSDNNNHLDGRMLIVGMSGDEFPVGSLGIIEPGGHSV